MYGVPSRLQVLSLLHIGVAVRYSLWGAAVLM